ncbi:ribbon-helix-helix protein, CopG family [Lysinibacter cavernae]|uniref:Metal-responsive CopG/Arc/MetJ family transcriptional regulator n=1 Tax=Lysinibacter cavernae TaxID=1640652 RepID=A0A7X5R350_9MICO|nr:ribbon-helix-helix protein, CopG family [Lysinibacter cavernae]NIH54754.1 metal-responsive CopG/Arc/MetJ family transcriptional regulator [Lysinibacter cavernae]
MKTAISVPDNTFEAVEKQARLLNMNRSEFFSVAAQRYLDELNREQLTNEMNAAIERTGGEQSAEIRRSEETIPAFAELLTDEQW